MQLIFTAVALLGTAYLVIRRRAFDIPALAYFGACFYFLPGFVGYVAYPEGVQVARTSIDNETYAVMIAVLLFVLGSAKVNERFINARPPLLSNSDAGLRSVAWAALAVAALGFVMTYVTVGARLFAGDKFALLAMLNRWHLLWSASATVAAVAAFVSRSQVLIVAAVLLLLVNLYVGFRVELVIAVIAIAAYYLIRSSSTRLISHWRLAAGIFSGAMFLFVYKYAQVSIQLLDIDLLLAVLQNPEAGERIFVYSEPFVVQGTLNEVVKQHYWVGPGHLTELFYLLVPFATELGVHPTGFNALFQPVLFSSVTEYGLANNIWAEMLASGGWLLMLVFALTYCSVLLLLDRMIRVVPTRWITPLLVVAAYWAFYIHRNDLLYELTLVRRVLIVSFGIFATAFVGRVIVVGWRSLSRSPPRRMVHRSADGGDVL